MSENQGNETITIKKDALWKYSTIALAAILVVGVFFVFSGNSGGTGNAVNNPPSGNSGSRDLQVSLDDDAVLGDKNAPVTIVEFSDYECPYCGRFYQDALPLIKSEYIDTGKVKLVFRDFPLSFHPNAMPSAIATECIKDLGGDDAFWQLHDKIFENQHSLSTASLKGWSKEIGYNIDSCLDTQKFRNEIQKDFTDGQSYGVKGTPAFFVNGKLISGAQPFSVFKSAIDAELA